MNSAFHRPLRVTLGAAALLALTAGCGGERRPAQPVPPTPPAGRTPPFESEVPYESHRQPPRGAGRAPIPGPGPGEPGWHHAEPPRGDYDDDYDDDDMSVASERQICQVIVDSASVSAQDIPGGVQLVLTPTPGTDTESLNLLARALQSRLGELSDEPQPPPYHASSRCPLFDMARMGASARVVEAADGIRVIFTSEDSSSVYSVREQARRFVRSAREGELR
ncbi:uncharacterized protein SOCEGT47_083870 [Sorangium cellulosum]|uniref:Uncharacterized protein n=1 Tax=Sorangium cellulosum TaxID=56 RepID=A0A4P2QDM3_SORCE|nr:hypothetical protein [Sorangium cellulosum]AUX27789.1 uncharacterized protein SOCEGT47_083870 [Sorangium cellulosum]